MKNTVITLLAFFVFQTQAQLKSIAYVDGAQKLNGLLASPKNLNKKKAGVLILPAWMGIDENAKDRAEKLAAQGYYAFVADIYGEGNYPKDAKKAGELSGFYKTIITEYHKRIKLALEELIKNGADPSNIVVIGFCFGGTGALEAARINMPVKGVVSFHGGLGRDTTRAVNKIEPKVLVCHGADDFFVPEAQIKSFQNEMRKAKADWEMTYYANAVHSFTDPAAGNDNSKGAAYNEKAAIRSWALMLEFLKEVFS
ncbi:MAG: dienelactone hydrolase family protein [Bacteroidetes bacterium]|nr:dienelactone hydrolase family protein [Bacteroidota bacterium]